MLIFFLRQITYPKKLTHHQFKMRYFIHCDNSFRKQQLSVSKLAFLDTDIDEEDSKKLNTITFLYGYTYAKINFAFSKMNIRLNRRNPDEISNCLTFCDCVILFHNFVEYSNGMQSIIDICLKEDIPLVIFSDHIKRGFLSNSTGDLAITQEFPKIVRNDKIIKVQDFNFEPYKYIPSISFKQVVELTRRNYTELNKEKAEKKIKYYNLSLKKS